MQIADVRLADVEGRLRLSAFFEFESRPERNDRIWIDWPGEMADAVDARIDPFAVLALPLSGVLREPLRAEGPVSSQLLHNLDEVGGVYEAYYPEVFRRAPMELEGETRVAHRGASASFFSGGVDSLYNLVETTRRADAGSGTPLDQLWLVQGFDIRLDQAELWKETCDRIASQVATRVPQKLVTIRTNVRALYHALLEWPQLGFSAALAGVAKCVAGSVSTVLFGSYTTYAKIIPHASTPLVDPLWSCEQQRIVHFSCLADRGEKLRVIAGRPELLESLRVCWRNPDQRYNCGRCDKCLRTQAQLLALGLQDSAKSFAWPLDLERIVALQLPWQRKSSYQWDFWRAIEAETLDRPELADLGRAIRRLLRRNRPRLLRRLVRSD